MFFVSKLLVGIGLVISGYTYGEESVMGPGESHLQTAWKVFQASDSNENQLISPLSLGTAMDMALSGASGATRSELQAFLSREESVREFKLKNRFLQKALEQGYGERNRLRSANALVVASGTHLVADSYRKELEQGFGARVFQGLEVDPVNHWVEQKTEGMIPKILAQLHPNAVCALLNATYFKGLWQDPFKESRTQAGTFYSPKKELDVPFMQQTLKLPLLTRDGFRAIALPYDGKVLRFVVLLPDEKDGLSALEDRLDAEALMGLLQDLDATSSPKVALRLPRFKLESSLSMKPVFEQLGLRLPFSPKEADFAGVTGKEESQGLLFIDQIQHKTVLELSEEGTEAAAATAVGFATRSMSFPEEFSVEHPFLFLIQDTKTDSVLFLGRMLNPKG